VRDALEALRLGFAAVEEMLRWDKDGSEGMPVPDAERPRVAALRSGAMVLIVAYFQAFLRDLASGFVREINRLSEARWQSLPGALRQIVLRRMVDDLGGALKTDVTGFPSKEADVLHRLGQYVGMVSGTGALRLDDDLFGKLEGNPGSAVVTDLLGDMGIPHVFDGRAPMKEALDGIVNRRNQFAHGWSSLGRTPQDIKSDMEVLRDVARLAVDAVEKVLASVRGTPESAADKSSEGGLA
jgi:hypothetical protein